MTLTSDQIKRGFWHFEKSFWQSKRKSTIPPKTITYIEDYKSCSRLNLVITQLGISSYQQNKLVQMWCEKLPQLTENV
jgi:hypothetical protein